MTMTVYRTSFRALIVEHFCIAACSDQLLRILTHEVGFSVGSELE